MPNVLSVRAHRIETGPAKRWFRGFAALILVPAAGAGLQPALSQTPPAQAPAAAQSDVEALLDVLPANGTITQKQYAALKQRFAEKRAGEGSTQLTHTRSESQGGIVSTSNSFALGPIGFF